jgi:Pyridine nucleotide-disulphide oxidoreductase
MARSRQRGGGRRRGVWQLVSLGVTTGAIHNRRLHPRICLRAFDRLFGAHRRNSLVTDGCYPVRRLLSSPTEWGQTVTTVIAFDVNETPLDLGALAGTARRRRHYDRSGHAPAGADVRLRRRRACWHRGARRDGRHDALRYHPELSVDDIHWVLVEATNRILPEVSEDLGAYTVVRLVKRGIDIRLGTTLESCVDGVVRLSDGASFPTDTIVWTAGVMAHPVLDQTDLPRDKKGRLTCLPTLQVVDEDGQVVPGGCNAGDCAAVPDLTGEPDVMCAPNAQNAVRQAKILADNLVSVIFGRAVRNYKHKYGRVSPIGTSPPSRTARRVARGR